MQSNIVIKNSKDKEDRNGGLGKALLIANQQVLVYRVKDIARYCNANINVVNPTAVNVKVKIWITRDKIPSEIDLIESNITLTPDAVMVRTNLVLGPDEAVFAQSDTDGVVIRVEGFENNPF